MPRTRGQNPSRRLPTRQLREEMAAAVEEERQVQWTGGEGIAAEPFNESAAASEEEKKEDDDAFVADLLKEGILSPVGNKRAKTSNDFPAIEGPVAFPISGVGGVDQFHSASLTDTHPLGAGFGSFLGPPAPAPGVYPLSLCASGGQFIGPPAPVSGFNPSGVSGGASEAERSLESEPGAVAVAHGSESQGVGAGRFAAMMDVADRGSVSANLDADVNGPRGLAASCGLPSDWEVRIVPVSKGQTKKIRDADECFVGLSQIIITDLGSNTEYDHRRNGGASKACAIAKGRGCNPCLGPAYALCQNGAAAVARANELGLNGWAVLEREDNARVSVCTAAGKCYHSIVKAVQAENVDFASVHHPVFTNVRDYDWGLAYGRWSVYVATASKATTGSFEYTFIHADGHTVHSLPAALKYAAVHDRAAALVLSPGDFGTDLEMIRTTCEASKIAMLRELNVFRATQESGHDSIELTDQDLSQRTFNRILAGKAQQIHPFHLIVMFRFLSNKAAIRTAVQALIEDEDELESTLDRIHDLICSVDAEDDNESEDDDEVAKDERKLAAAPDGFVGGIRTAGSYEYMQALQGTGISEGDLVPLLPPVANLASPLQPDAFTGFNHYAGAPSFGKSPSLFAHGGAYGEDIEGITGLDELLNPKPPAREDV